MINNKKLILLSAVVSILLMSGCGKKDAPVSAKPMIGQEKTVSQSQPNTPSWIVRRPEADDKNLYFVGDDTAKNISGVRDAYQVALSKISFYINAKVDAGYKRIESNLDNDTANTLKQEMIQNVAQSSIQGAKEKEIYWEKVEKVTATGLSYYYQVYSLVAVPKTVIQDSAKATLLAQQEKHKAESDQKTYDQLKSVEGDFNTLFDKN
eukprot:COSAG01_NODE_814_length_13398_cov_4.254230_7_plen_208_part_00